MKLSHLTWVEVEKYLKTKNALLIPIGSTEQHGPTGLLGTDHLCAEAVALEVGERLGIMVAPSINYGMASHHMAFSGSATMRPSIYQAMLAEILRSFYHHGFRRFYFVNGHGGNINSVSAVFQEMKHEGFAGASFAIYNWWKMPEVTELATQLYGEKEGFHATPSEVSLTFHLAGIDRRPYDAASTSVDAKAPWPMTAQEVRAVFPTGAMKSDPGLARGEHGKKFLEASALSICNAIQKAAYLE